MKHPLASKPFLLGAIALATLLAGCNGVTSYKPMLTQADAKDAPRLREGIWYGSSNQSTPCAVDEKQPIDAWPDCARPLLVQKSGLVGLEKVDGRWKRTAWSFVLAPGQPDLVQIGDREAGKPVYAYGWLRVTGLDDQGRVITIAAGSVNCGSASTPLYPGLVKQDQQCTPTSVEALRGAAKASQTDDPELVQAHWVRDGSR